MKRIAWPLFFTFIILCGLAACSSSDPSGFSDDVVVLPSYLHSPPASLQAMVSHPGRMDKMSRPDEHFYLQRSYPDAQFDLMGYNAALASAKSVAQSPAKTLAGVSNTPWTLEGPTNIGGRINALAVDPNNASIRFAGTSAGGIFKTTNGGFSWDAIFDTSTHLAIGDITFEPGNSQVIYAGTGDPNIGGYVFLGDGVYKSTDGGNSWNNIGLQDARIVSRILVDPNNVNKIYVSTMGLPQERNNDRGLYVSNDGGQTWSQSLFVSNEAGIIDLVMDPNNSQVLYASSWNRIRNNYESMVYGTDAKVWKTSDGGGSWTHLTNGLPSGTLSRVNLAIDQGNPAKVYVCAVDSNFNVEGVYQSTNGGSNWNTIPTANLSSNALGGFGWYFGNIFVNPFSPNDIYICGVQLWRTQDMGQTWATADPGWWTYEVHADKHDMLFTGPDSYYLATDGGIYETQDNGVSWSDADEIPNTQFYRVAANPHFPDSYYGGAQDNGTCSGNAGNITAWQRNFGGDGFQMLFDNNPNHLVVETQNGYLSHTLDGGSTYNDFNQGIDFNDRRSWDMPVTISSINDQVYYCGTYRVYQNTTGLDLHNWFPISPDLTDGIASSSRGHVITTVSESPFNASVVYAGTSDGNVHVTTDGGGTWTDISNGLPDRYITSVKASQHNPDEVFATVSGYKFNEFIPHILRSTNKGATWTNVSGNLPQLALNDVLVHPVHDSVWVVASDGGVFATQDRGINWERVGNNMPICPVYDMDWDLLQNRLVAGTHARSLMTFPVDSLLPSGVISALHDTPALEVSLYPNPATDYIELKSPESGTRFTLHDIQGRLLKSNRITGFEKRIPIQDLPAGTYLVQVEGLTSNWYGKLLKR